MNKVEELDNKINKNSSNSSTPPSTDPKKRPKSNRGQTGNKTGGQPLTHEQSRQVFEIEILNKVIEHQTFSTVCTWGEKHCCEFPEGVTGHTQYGASVRGIISYLSKYQLIPSERLSQMMEDIFNYGVSEGTIDNIKNESASSLNDFEEKIN